MTERKSRAHTPAKSTPRPWAVLPATERYGEDYAPIRAGNVTLADVYPTDGTHKTRSQMEANAALIVRAVNAFDPLVSALEGLLADVEQYEAWQRPCHAVDVARAALSLAKDGTK
jgi:hypothetical protein